MNQSATIQDPTESTEAQSQDSLDVIGQRLVDTGLITAEQLRYARRVQDRMPGAANLMGVLEELHLTTADTVRTSLKNQRIHAPIGLLLFELGYVDNSHLKMALTVQKGRPDDSIGAILVENRAVSEEQFVDVLALQLGLERLYPLASAIDRRLIRKAAQWYRSRDMIPIERRDRTVVIALENPLNPEHVRAAQREFGKELILGIASRREIHQALSRFDTKHEDAPIEFGENVVVDAVAQIIRDAAKARASDIHIEPQKDGLRVRFRLDGVLTDYERYPIAMGRPMLSRIKVLAQVDIAQKRRHQDGRLLFEEDGITHGLRLSTYISVHGETAVLRLLNTRSELLDIKRLGMGPLMEQKYLDCALDAPSGVVIITGPTGSGKTTTLYSSVNYLNNPHSSIITAEDPVEYMVHGITQCSINPKMGITFEKTLKHIVRQDSDIIVIGEMRDTFSADTAIQAALTGHKVLTTFHTEDSIGGLIRLLNMDIEAFLISSTVVSVLAQRLVRRVCPNCAADAALAPHQMARLGYDAKDLDGSVFKEGRGCGECHFTGYNGRIPVFELLVLNELVKDAVLMQKSSSEIRQLSVETSGMVTLLEDAVHKAVQGLTTFDEIIRQIPRIGSPRPVSEIRRLLGEAS